MSHNTWGCREITTDVGPQYPIYLREPVQVRLHPWHERAPVKVPSSTLETRTSLPNDGRSDCRLDDILHLRNVKLTRAYLRAKLSTTVDKSDKRDITEDPYALIDVDTRDSVDRVMNELDLENAKLILTYGPDRDLRRRHFFYNLVTQRRDPKSLGLLVQRCIEWKILDKEGSKVIEQEVFQRADKEVVRVFLQHRVDLHIEASFGSNALAALFANPHFKVTALKRKKNRLLANAAGHEKFTALHYAMKSKDPKKVKYLLDRGAKPNCCTRFTRLRPLTLGLWRPTEDPQANEKCVELLMQHGANPFFNQIPGLWGCALARHSSIGARAPLYAPAEYLTKLVLAYACLHDIVGSLAVREHIELAIREFDDLLEFCRRCRCDLEMLEKHEVRRGLTMFHVVARTGERLFRIVNAEDERTICGFIEKYRESGTINAYYVNAMREHMRQVRKLVAHRNRATRVIAESATILAPYFVVMRKIVGYLTYKDLIMFQ